MKKERGGKKGDVRSSCNLFEYIIISSSNTYESLSRIDLDLTKVFIRDTNRDNGVAITLKEENERMKEKKEKRKKKIIGGPSDRNVHKNTYELCPDSIDGNSREQRHGE